MAIWLQLVRHRRFPDSSGREKLYYPGQVISIKNKKLAAQLIKDGFAVDASIQNKDLPDDAGILLRRKVATLPAWVEASELKTTTGKLGLPYVHTLAWDPAVKPNRRFIVPTFRLLKIGGWDVLAPIRSYDKLLRDIPLTEEKAETEALLHDLRIPYFEVRLLWLKRNQRTENLLKEWQKQMEGGKDARLAFMRALYIVKPFVLALPCCWMVRR